MRRCWAGLAVALLWLLVVSTAGAAAPAPPASLLLSPSTLPLQLGEEGRSYSIMLTSRPQADVALTLSGGADLILAPSSLTFTPADWFIPQEVRVTPFRNDKNGQSLHAAVTHRAASADPAYHQARLPALTVLIGPGAPDFNWRLAREGGVGHSQVHAVAVDKEGMLYLAGSFVGQATFGGTMLQARVPSTLESKWQDLFVAKWDPASGRWRWAVQGGFDCPAEEYDCGAWAAGSVGGPRAEALAIDQAGNIYVAGSFPSAAIFDVGEFAQAAVLLAGEVVQTAGGEERFLAKLNPAQEWEWVITNSTTGDDAGSAIALVGERVFLGGRNNGDQLLLAAYNQNGELAWESPVRAGMALAVGQEALWAAGQGFVAQVDSTTGKEVARISLRVNLSAIALDKERLYLAGSFGRQGLTLGELSLTGTAESNLFLAAWDLAGEKWLWAKAVAGASAKALAPTSDGELLLLGAFRGEVVADSTLLSSSGEQDLLLATLDAKAGDWLWAVNIGGEGDDQPGGIALHKGQLMLAGTFDPNLFLGEQVVIGSGGRESFILATYAKDTESPEPGTARVTGLALSIRFDEALDHQSVPGFEAFHIAIDGDPQEPPVQVGIAGNELTLRLAAAAQAGDEVLISYTPLVEAPLADLAGNKVKAFAALPVRNATPDTVPPTWPDWSQLTHGELDESMVHLTWTPAEDKVGLAGYRIRHGQQRLARVDAEQLSAWVLGLAPGTTYTLQVDAQDEAGNWSADGPTVRFKTPGEAALPSWPLGSELAPAEQGETDLLLTWSEADGTSRYRLYQDDRLLAESPAAGERLFWVTGLELGSTYTFRVEAGNEAGDWTEEGPALTIRTPSALRSWAEANKRAIRRFLTEVGSVTALSGGVVRPEPPLLLLLGL